MTSRLHTYRLPELARLPGSRRLNLPTVLPSTHSSILARQTGTCVAPFRLELNHKSTLFIMLMMPEIPNLMKIAVEYDHQLTKIKK